MTKLCLLFADNVALAWLFKYPLFLRSVFFVAKKWL